MEFYPQLIYRLLHLKTCIEKYKRQTRISHYGNNIFFSGIGGGSFPIMDGYARSIALFNT